MYVNVIKNYIEAIIKCRYRLTYMLILLLINLVVFLKWDHVDSNSNEDCDKDVYTCTCSRTRPLVCPLCCLI